ncbi:MAG: MerR family transcriptional regulator [Thermodesulfobacteriota bacterium]
MPQAKLYSIAAVAKLLDLPESTLHYWKNRFDQLLPSVGTGRHKRFRADAVEIFRAIGNLLGAGLSVADAKAELAKRFPVNITPEEGQEPSPVSPLAAPSQTGASGEELAARIGAAMADALSRNLQAILQHPAASQAALPLESMESLKSELAAAREEIALLRQEGETSANKLRVLEAELIRLRREGREMEKHLLGKIKAGR